MTKVWMSEQEARRAGLLTSKTKTTRKSVPRSKSTSRCQACGEEFTSDAAETRHVEETGHARYETETT